MVRFHSFDVFDTSLIRKVASPPDVFRLVGRRVLSKVGAVDQEKFVEDFSAARVRAEEIARSKRSETTLNEIWAHLHELMPDLPSTFGAKDELEAEQEVLAPNAIMAEQIARSRSAGARIMFTSDTYLPEEFVRAQLVRHGLAHPGDGFYVSNAAQAAKWTGDLFKVILEREGISPKDLSHCGDDFHSDVVMPRALGIKATLVSSAWLNVWENALLSNDLEYRVPISSLVGSMRAFRLRAGFDSSAGVRELVATLLGPALTVWAAWVLRAAQRDGIRRLYFVSRDAYLLCRAARVLAGDFGNIECRHLRISRHSVLLPATQEVNSTGMFWLRRPSKPIRLGFLTWKLGLNWQDVAKYFSKLTKGEGKSWSLTAAGEWDEFWNIIQNPPVVGILRGVIKKRRADLLAYLRAEGICDGVPAGIVDLGWHVEVQTSLRRVLEEDAGVSVPIGYYLGLRAIRKAQGESGKAIGLFYEQAPYHQFPGPQYEIFKRIDVLDHIFGLAPYGTVHGYKVNGASVDPVGPIESPSHADFVVKVGDEVESFCADVHEHAADYSNSDIAREILDRLIRAWCVQPDQAALERLSHLEVTYGTDAIPAQPLVESWRLLDAMKTLIPERILRKLRTQRTTPIWLEAAFYRSGLLTQFILRLSVVLRLMRGRGDRELLTFFRRRG